MNRRDRRRAEARGPTLDELTLLAVAKAIKAESGVTYHRIVDPRREDGRVTFGLAFPQRKAIHAQRAAPLRISTSSRTSVVT